MVGVGDDVQLLVVARQPPERILAEIARVRTLAVEQQHGAADLVAVLHCRIGIFIKDSEDVTFQPLLELRERG